MKQFKHYCKEIRDIDGIKTCIVSHEYLDDVLSDLEILSILWQSMPIEDVKKAMQYLVREVKCIHCGKVL